MSKLISQSLNVSIMVSLLAMFGCSSSGGGDSGVAAPLYSGSTTPAAITQANAADVGEKSTEGVNEAVNLSATGEALPFFPVGFEATSGADALANKVRDIAFAVMQSSNTLNLPVGILYTADDLNAGQPSPVFCGGSVSMPDNVDPEAPTQDFTMSFNSLCYDDGVNALMLNGSIRFVKTTTSASITFTNFSVSMDGMQETFSGVFSCDADMNNCAIATDYAGSDGNVYRLADVDINGTDLTGYTLTATFYHPEHGQVVIATVSPVTYGGCGIYPSDGVITATSSDGSSITVTYNGCTYSITGVDANTGSISVNGSWT